MNYRVFYTLHKLSKSEEEKLLKWSRQGGDKPDIKYRKKKVVEVVEAGNVVQASNLIYQRHHVPSGITMEIWNQFATVYAVVEYREGQKLSQLEECFEAGDVDLIPKEEA